MIKSQKLAEAVDIILHRRENHIRYYKGRAGLCGEMCGAIIRSGVEGTIIDGYVIFPDGTWFYHTWVALPCGNIWDLSASQFNLKGLSMPDEYFGMKPDNYVSERPKSKMWVPTNEQYEEYWLKQQYGLA